ncbi:MAG: zinc-ribbon domain-containing protein [Methanothermobacter sp.]|nr:zinc-ribbon domain-containing protein [Methanothermobacter sp.]
MVYCPKCGKKNEEDAEFCSGCGAPLQMQKPKGDTCFGQPEERYKEECFGLPHGGLIIGVIFGTLLIIIGISAILKIDIGYIIGPSIMIIIGILIIAGAIYKTQKS